MNPREFDFGRLFEAVFGWHEFRNCRNGEMATHVMEAAGPVLSNTFNVISSQLLFSTVMEAYEAEDFVFTKMIPTKSTPFLRGEKIPGITNMGDQATVVLASTRKSARSTV